jgi:hypothetical protein
MVTLPQPILLLWPLPPPLLLLASSPSEELLPTLTGTPLLLPLDSTLLLPLVTGVHLVVTGLPLVVMIGPLLNKSLWLCLSIDELSMNLVYIHTSRRSLTHSQELSPARRTPGPSSWRALILVLLDMRSLAYHITYLFGCTRT